MSSRRIRLTAVVAGLAGAAIVLAAWTQPWFTVDQELGEPFPITGQSTVPGISALAFAALAASGALTIAGRRLRPVLSVVEALLGIGVIALTWAQLADPSRAVESVLADGTGLIDGAVATTTGWPAIAIVGGALVTLAGAAALITSRHWPQPTAKYETDAARRDSAAGAWDALSEGDDPTR